MKNAIAYQTKNKTEINQSCTKCYASYEVDQMLAICPGCGGKLAYEVSGIRKLTEELNENSLWRNFDLLPLLNRKNIVSLGEGNSPIIELEELSYLVNGARIFLMLDSEKNPTGVFKDREASIILSRCKEIGLDNLVFYSTANTGRSYTHYASTIGLTTFMFMPRQCHYKNTKHIRKTKNNYIIYVDDNYPLIAPFAKKFAEINNFKLIAPLHDRNECYSTVAYEQFEHLPNCNYFVQTIASGMGPIGFFKGHTNLIKLGLQRMEKVPKIICVQSSEMNIMAHAYNSGKTTLTHEDLPKTFTSDLYEPTLNSTNPVNNYDALFKTLKDTKGLIIDVTPEFCELQSQTIIKALQNRGLFLRSDIEKSFLIEFAGLIKLGLKQEFKKDEIILMISCGRGRDTSTELYLPDAVINPATHDPVLLRKQLRS